MFGVRWGAIRSNAGENEIATDRLMKRVFVVGWFGWRACGGFITLV